MGNGPHSLLHHADTNRLRQHKTVSIDASTETGPYLLPYQQVFCISRGGGPPFWTPAVLRVRYHHYLN